MSHLSHDPDRLLARVRRIRGQVEAIERAVTEGRDCGEILHLVASVRGATQGLTQVLIEDHLRLHVADEADAEARHKGAAELAAALRSYLG
jgi:DNA-binding FrmR family transcriptional regulator